MPANRRNAKKKLAENPQVVSGTLTVAWKGCGNPAAVHPGHGAAWWTERRPPYIIQ